jgi:hypothetical protein
MVSFWAFLPLLASEERRTVRGSRRLLQLSIPGKQKMPEITQSANSLAEEKSPAPHGHCLHLQELLHASKDAERLLSCFFDLHAIEGEPFQGIWDRLASAIDRAQHALQPHCAQLHEAEDEHALFRRPV